MGAHAARFSVAFDEQCWERAMAPFRREVVAVATKARTELERDGLSSADIEYAHGRVGPKGTRLERCIKVRVPLGEPSASTAPFGFVLQFQADGAFTFISFGRRHPPPDERDVDERAHRVLHGRFPDQE